MDTSRLSSADPESNKAGQTGQERWHGTAGGYHNHGCHCGACMAAWGIAMRHARIRRQARRDPAWLAAELERVRERLAYLEQLDAELRVAAGSAGTRS